MFVCTDTEPDARRGRVDDNVLALVSAATTVRARNGELLVSRGLFAEPRS